MSATIDTSLFREYFGDCPIIEIHGRTFPVQEYFLEDTIQMLDFVPVFQKKRKNKNNNNNNNADEEVDDDDADEDQVGTDDAEDTNCNAIVPDDYTEKTRNSMRQLSEKNISFELIESLLKYIVGLNQPGGILIFMPGWNLIVSLLKHLRESPFFGNSNKFILLPLHSQIPREEQYKVFEDVSASQTKIIVSTNIAESSITINDIVYVIDSCKVKQKIFTARNNMTNYATVWASKSNLDQRKGRAGRVRSGYCFYLISRTRYERLDNHGTPEIFRTPLLELALSIKLLRLGEIKQFLSRAIEPPPLDAVAEAEIALIGMDAFDLNRELTPLGKILARLPIEPKLGKMIIMGCMFQVGDAVCTIAAASTFPEPFVHEGRYMLERHKCLSGARHSDHTALLVAFQLWLKAKHNGDAAEKEFCERKCLNMQTMRMTYEARNQLKDIMLMSGFPDECLHEATTFDPNNSDHRLDVITSLLAYALYPNVCYHTSKRKLLTCDGKQALIHKNSVNCAREISTFPSPFFVFGEKIKTRAVSAKQMTMVTPLQLLLLASDKIETVPNESHMICLDDWINLKIEREVASIIVSMRSAMDSVLAQCTLDPNMILKPPIHMQKFIETFELLSDQSACHISFKNASNTPCGFIQVNAMSSLMSTEIRIVERNDQSVQEQGPSLKRTNLGNEYPGFVADNNYGSYQNRGTFNNNTGTGSYRGGGYNGGHRGSYRGGFSNNNNYNQKFGFANNHSRGSHGGYNSNNNNNNNYANNRGAGEGGNNSNYSQESQTSDQQGFNANNLNNTFNNRPLPPHLFNNNQPNNFNSNFGNFRGRGAGGGGGGGGSGRISRGRF